MLRPCLDDERMDERLLLADASVSAFACMQHARICAHARLDGERVLCLWMTVYPQRTGAGGYIVYVCYAYIHRTR